MLELDRYVRIGPELMDLSVIIRPVCENWTRVLELNRYVRIRPE